MTPKRVTVIGNGGSGKTTLSRALSESLKLPLFHMDRLIWQPGWQPTPEVEVRASLEEIFRGEQWLIDGLGPLWSIEMRIAVADRIIFLDFPLDHCRSWAMQRQKELGSTLRTDVTEGCFLEGMDQRMYDLLGVVDAEYLPVIRQLLSPEVVAAKTTRLTDPSDLDPFQL